MKIAIITHVPHFLHKGQYFSYGPYVREINIWIRNAREVIIVAPLGTGLPGVIDLSYQHSNIVFRAIPEFNLLSIRNIFSSLVVLPRIVADIYLAMRAADHIHLRCPGNVGLLGCMVQILFPGKQKTAKYAGNWDPLAIQPLSYKIQKWILNNTFLTRNMTAVVYGDWPGSSVNIKPFFTATYRKSDITAVPVRPLIQPIKLLFVGTLSAGKQPMLVMALADGLFRRKISLKIDFYGEGIEMDKLKAYIESRFLEQSVTIHGNQPEDVIRTAYQSSHFLILPSKSEGWPKVVAEAMFWGCVPLATPVSCVAEMLGHGQRGIILSGKIDDDIDAMAKLLSDPEEYAAMASNGMAWAQQYTLEYFEEAINHILTKSAPK